MENPQEQRKCGDKKWTSKCTGGKEPPLLVLVSSSERRKSMASHLVSGNGMGHLLFANEILHYQLLHQPSKAAAPTAAQVFYPTSTAAKLTCRRDPTLM